jgi:hypothetical protein
LIHDVEGRNPGHRIEHLWIKEDEENFVPNFIQWIRDEYLKPGGRIIAIVNNLAQPALLDGLIGLPTRNHTMRKIIGTDKEPSPPVKWYPDIKAELMEGEKAMSFLASAEADVATYIRKASMRPTPLTKEEASAILREVNEKLLPQGTDTVNNYFYHVETDKGEKVGSLWLRLQEDTSSYQCHYIKVAPR